MVYLTKLSVSQYHLASSDLIMYVLNWKKCGRKPLWPNLGFCSGMSGETEGDNELSPCSSRYSNPVPPGYKSEAYYTEF
jgi:hypothetical protein